jgi:hypothetical protein
LSEWEVASRVRERFGLRIEAEMSRYVLEKLAKPPESLAVIGGDARTGIPRRQMVDPRLLLSSSQDL